MNDKYFFGLLDRMTAGALSTSYASEHWQGSLAPVPPSDGSDTRVHLQMWPGSRLMRKARGFWHS